MGRDSGKCLECNSVNPTVTSVLAGAPMCSRCEDRLDAQIDEMKEREEMGKNAKGKEKGRG